MFPDVRSRKQDSSRGQTESEGGLKLKIANTKQDTDKKASARKPPVARGAKPGTASYLYRITERGYVTEVFSEAAVLLCLAEQEGTILVGTGNEAKLFAVDPEAERQTILYEDDQAAQITAVAVSGSDVYIGTANPAKLIHLSADYATARHVYLRSHRRRPARQGGASSRSTPTFLAAARSWSPRAAATSRT